MSYNYQDDPLWQELEASWYGLEFAGALSEMHLRESVVTALRRERAENTILANVVMHVLRFLEDDMHQVNNATVEAAALSQRRLDDLIELTMNVKRADLRRRLDAIYD